MRPRKPRIIFRRAFTGKAICLFVSRFCVCYPEKTFSISDIAAPTPKEQDKLFSNLLQVAPSYCNTPGENDTKNGAAGGGEKVVIKSELREGDNTCRKKSLSFLLLRVVFCFPLPPPIVVHICRYEQEERERTHHPFLRLLFFCGRGSRREGRNSNWVTEEEDRKKRRQRSTIYDSPNIHVLKREK